MSILIKGMEMPKKGEYRMTLYVCDDGYAYMDVDLFPVDKDRFEAIPTADVREVVLCRDCKNRFMTPNGRRCYYAEWDVEDDDFCSCGERKDGADMKGEAE